MKNRRTIKHTGLLLLLLCGILSVLFTAVGCEDRQASAPEQTKDAQESSVNPDAAPADLLTTGDQAVEPKQQRVAETHLQVVEIDDIKALITETAQRDQVLVIDFWATWCVPCVEMFPSLHEGLLARGESVRAVTVTLDDPSREPAAIEFLNEHDALHDAYIFVNDSAAQQALADGLGEKWDSLAVPAILVYDTRGALTGEFLEGGSTDAILEHVDGLLESGQPASP